MSEPGCVHRISFSALTASAVILSAAAFCYAGQEPSPKLTRTKWEFGLAFNGAAPTGAFLDSLGQDSVGAGIGGYFGHRLGNSPFSLGLEFNYINYGDRTRHERVTGILPLEVEVSTTNNILQPLLYLRCQPWEGAIRPYLEALGGLNYLYTETSINEENYPNEEIESETNFDDTTFCAGVGLGMDVHIWGERRTPDVQLPTEIRLDFKVRYLIGGQARFLKEDSIIEEDGRLTYLYQESTTNLITFHIGVSANF